MARRKAAAGLAAGVVVVATMAACGDGDNETSAAARSGGLRPEPTAGQWKTWVVSPAQIAVPVPPEAGSADVELDLQEVERLAEERTPEVREAVAKWSGPNPAEQ